MSCNLPNTNLLLNNKNYKKPKRKRRKNKNKKYCSLTKKKFQKKFHRRNSSDLSCGFKMKKSQSYDSMQPADSSGIMSNWYWSNYKKAIEWQDKHKIAHWKACALALQEENRYLMQIINNIQPGMCEDLTFTTQDLFKNISNKPSRCKVSKESKKRYQRMSESFQEDTNDNDNDYDYDNDNEYEFEMSEEMMQFFEQSFKHKMDLEKMKEERKLQDDAEAQVIEIQSNRVRRLKEMELLYGEAASMIIGMETAVQLSFDKYCDTKSPKYWPNIPLKL